MDVRRRRCAAVVHRTFLARNGQDKAPVEPTKMMEASHDLRLEGEGGAE
jgi:hypothetical protein